MRMLLIGLSLIVQTTVFAASPLSFQSDREGESFYSTHRKFERSIKKVLKKISGEEIVSTFQSILQKTEEGSACSFTMNERLLHSLPALRSQDLEGVIYHLRKQNEIDDVVAKILLKAHETKQTELIQIPENFVILPFENAENDELLGLVTSFEDKYLKGNCLDEAYKNLANDMVKVKKHIESYDMAMLFLKAQRTGKINSKTYVMLEEARQNELEKFPLTLKTYLQRIKTLRTQYPLRDATEKSEFVTEKIKKTKLSRRQRLYESYTELQIILMGNVIKRLRTRLESPRIEILVYDKDKNEEVVPLEPMERFRFAIKILRKEMAQLSLNTYFSGRSPDYIDVMTAAYEIGLIPASELDEVAGLEEIWNPKKTFWDKAGMWVKTFSSVATIVVPPPYGFIPALAVVVIEATVGKKDKPENSASLF